MNYGDFALCLFIALVAGYAGGWAALRFVVRRMREMDRGGE